MIKRSKNDLKHDESPLVTWIENQPILQSRFTWLGKKKEKEDKWKIFKDKLKSRADKKKIFGEDTHESWKIRKDSRR